MTKETAIIQLGVKGSDVVMSTLNKANALKDKYSKSSTARLKIESNRKTLSDASRIEHKASKAEELRNAEAVKTEHALRNFTPALNNAANAATQIGQGMASLNPTDLIKSVSGAGFALASGVAQGAGNAAWGGVGDAAKAVIDYAGKMTDIAISMGSNAVAAVKASLPIAVQQTQQLSMIKGMGLDRGGEGSFFNQATMSRAEMSGLSSSLMGTMGKITSAGFEHQLKRLFVANENNQLVQREQAMQMAQGNFSGLGTNKGFFMNQISSQFQGLPPEIRQELTSQLQSMVSDEELMRENATRRKNQVAIEQQDLSSAARISDTGAMQSIGTANGQLNGLTEQMVGQASKLSSALGTAADGLTKFLNNIDKIVSDSSKAAAKARQQ